MGVCVLARRSWWADASGSTPGRSDRGCERNALRVARKPQRVRPGRASRSQRNRSLSLRGYSSWNRGNMDDLNWEAGAHEHLPERTREFLLSDDPPDRHSTSGPELALRLLKLLSSALEVLEKVQPL